MKSTLQQHTCHYVYIAKETTPLLQLPGKGSTVSLHVHFNFLPNLSCKKGYLKLKVKRECFSHDLVCYNTVSYKHVYTEEDAKEFIQRDAISTVGLQRIWVGQPLSTWTIGVAQWKTTQGRTTMLELSRDGSMVFRGQQSLPGALPVLSLSLSLSLSLPPLATGQE